MRTLATLACLLAGACRTAGSPATCEPPSMSSDRVRWFDCDPLRPDSTRVKWGEGNADDCPMSVRADIGACPAIREAVLNRHPGAVFRAVFKPYRAAMHAFTNDAANGKDVILLVNAGELWIGADGDVHRYCVTRPEANAVVLTPAKGIPLL